MRPGQPPTALLSVENLAVSFAAGRGRIRVLHDVSIHLDKGTTLGIVGESGCGKSVTSLAVIRLLGRGAAVDHGSVFFGGQDLLALPEAQMREIRGRDIAMVFQDPMSSLNPVLTIGEQITEAIRTRRGARSGGARRRGQRRQASARAAELLQMVGIPAGEAALRRYPHEFSGGMRQRVMIAAALALSPMLLIADEPTTALDVTIQAQVLELMQRLVRDTGAALMLVTHNLGVVAGMTERVAVMYAGRIVEEAQTADLFAWPAHPYTVGLLHSLPGAGTRGRDLIPIPGVVPDPGHRLAGCSFAPRCRWRLPVCWTEQPPLLPAPPSPGPARRPMAPARPGMAPARPAMAAAPQPGLAGQHAHVAACHNPVTPGQAAAGRPGRALPAAPAPAGITDFAAGREAAG